MEENLNKNHEAEAGNDQGQTPVDQSEKQAVENTSEENVPVVEQVEENTIAEEIMSQSYPQEKVADLVEKVKKELSKVIIGQEEMIEFLLAGLFTSGHVLLEGVPGIAKTLAAKLMAQCLSVDFSRIQFTPDMMPSDVIGTTVYNIQNSEFSFTKGPIFSNMVLIDEVNRAPAKTQAALFEVMEERQISVDGITYKMDSPFFIIATQNPIEQEGTYRLPEAQLDRFLFRIKMKYPNLSEEEQILQRFKNDFYSDSVKEEVMALLSAEEVAASKKLIEEVYIKDELLSYIAQIVHDTRENGDLFMGASPRASLAILKSAKAMAAFEGRNFVSPDDIRKVSEPVLNHRIILSPEREMEGVQIEQVIAEIVKKIEVPR